MPIVHVYERIDNLYREIAIQLIQSCNLDCPYCFAEKNSNLEIPNKELEQFISFFKKNKLNSLKITGGEPFLFKGIYDFISRFDKETPIIIFSNLTINKCVEKLPDRNITILVNVNDKDMLKERIWHILEENICIAKNKRIRIILCKTFYKSKFDISEMLYLADKFDIKKMRFSQSSPKSDKKNIWYEFNKTTEMYEYIYNIYNTILKPRNIKIQFDCPVAPCKISSEIFDFFNAEECIKAVCRSRLFITSDFRVHHCYVTANYIGGKRLDSFDSYETAFDYIDKQIKDFNNKNHNDACRECRYYGEYIPCGCFTFKQG